MSDEPALNALTDMELVALQKQARDASDKKLKDQILRILGKRQRSTESLRYMYINDEIEDTYEVVIQFSGGGVRMTISRNDNSRVIAHKLRDLAELIEMSVAERVAK